MRDKLEALQALTIATEKLQIARRSDSAMTPEEIHQAEEVRSTAAFRLLQLEADAIAVEVLRSGKSRPDLLNQLRGFLEAALFGGPELRCTRAISAALRDSAPGSLDSSPSAAAAAALWQRRFEELLAGH